MKKIILFLILFIYFLSTNVYAGRGCCSHHGGQNYCGSDGYWYCNDGTRSPTCTCSGASTSTTNSSVYQKQDVYGCTSSDSINYNSLATKDDGSCIQKVFGCTDKKAVNYSESANTTDQSCLYKKVLVKKQKIKYRTIKKYKFFRKEGSLIRKGEYGQKQIKYELIKNESGEITDKKIIDEKTVKKPITRIISTRKK